MSARKTWEAMERLCATVEHWHREAHPAAKDREDAENWRTLMSEAANAPDHAEMIERATQAFEENQEELRLLRACEDATLTVEVQEEPEERLTAARLQLQAWSDLRAFRARQKERAG